MLNRARLTKTKGAPRGNPALAAATSARNRALRKQGLPVPVTAREARRLTSPGLAKTTLPVPPDVAAEHFLAAERAIVPLTAAETLRIRPTKQQRKPHVPSATAAIANVVRALQDPVAELIRLGAPAAQAAEAVQRRHAISQLREQLGTELAEPFLVRRPISSPPGTPAESALALVSAANSDVVHTPLQALELIPEPVPEPEPPIHRLLPAMRRDNIKEAEESYDEPLSRDLIVDHDARRLTGNRARAREMIWRAPSQLRIWRVDRRATPFDFQTVIGAHPALHYVYHAIDTPEGLFKPGDEENEWYGVTTMERDLVHTVRVKTIGRNATVTNMFKALKALSYRYLNWVGYIQLYNPHSTPVNFELFHGELNCVLAAIARQVPAKAGQIREYALNHGFKDGTKPATKEDVNAFARAFRVGIRVRSQVGIWHEAGIGNKQKIVELFASDRHASDYVPVTFTKQQVVCTERRAIGPYKHESERPVVSAQAVLREYYDGIHGVKRINATVTGANLLTAVEALGDTISITAFCHADTIYKMWAPEGVDAENPDYFTCTSELSYITKKWKRDNNIRPLQEPYFSIFRAADRHLTTQQFQPYLLTQADAPTAPPTVHDGNGACAVCGEFHDLDFLTGVTSTCPGAEPVAPPKAEELQSLYHSYDMNKAFPSFKMSPLYAKYKIFYGYVNLYANTDPAYIQRPGASLVTAVVYHNPVIEAMRWVEPGGWYVHQLLDALLSAGFIEISISHSVIAASEDLEYPFGDPADWSKRKQLNNAFIGNLIMGGMGGIVQDVYAVRDELESQQIVYELRRREDTTDVVPMNGCVVHSYRTKQKQLYHIHAQILAYQQVTMLDTMCRVPLSNLVVFFTDGFYTREPIDLVSSSEPGRFKYEGLKAIKGASTYMTMEHETSDAPENAPPLSAHVNRLVGFKATTGPAGCGKTYISFEKHPRVAKVSLAPTHKKKADLLRYPALQVATYHKFFKIGTCAHDRKQQIAEQVDIDEITMCTDDHMKQIITICARHRMNLSIYGDFALTGGEEIRIFQRPPPFGKPITERLLAHFKVTEEISSVRRQDPVSAAWLDELRDMEYSDILARCTARFPVVSGLAIPLRDNTIYGISSRHERCTAFNRLFADNNETIRVRRAARSTKTEHKGLTKYLPPGDDSVWNERQRANDKLPKGKTYEAAQFVTSDYIQGDTIKGPIYVDLMNAKAENFLYVALTRCETLAQIHLIEDPAMAAKRQADAYQAAYKKYTPWIRMPLRTDIPEPTNDIERGMYEQLDTQRAPHYNHYNHYEFPAEPDMAAACAPQYFFRLADAPKGTFVIRDESPDGNRHVAFRSAGEYFVWREGLPAHARTHHEIMHRSIRAVYVDIDEEIPLTDTRFNDIKPAMYAARQQALYVGHFLSTLQRHITHGQESEILLTYADLIVLEACGQVQKEGKEPAYKLSFHIICPRIAMDTVRMTAFATELDRIARIDLSVYSANRSMRMMGCVKPGSTRVLRPSAVLQHMMHLTPWQLFSLSLITAKPPTRVSHPAMATATDHHYTSNGRVVAGKHLWATLGAAGAADFYFSRHYYDAALGGPVAVAKAVLEVTDERVKAIMAHPAVAPQLNGLSYTGTRKGCLLNFKRAGPAYVCAVCQCDHNNSNDSYYLLARVNGSVAIGCCYDASLRKAAGGRSRHVELIGPTVVEPAVVVERVEERAVEAPFDADVMAALNELQAPATAPVTDSAGPRGNTARTIARYSTMGAAYIEARESATDDNEPPLTDVEQGWRLAMHWKHHKSDVVGPSWRYELRCRWLREGKTLPIQLAEPAEVVQVDDRNTAQTQAYYNVLISDLDTIEAARDRATDDNEPPLTDTELGWLRASYNESYRRGEDPRSYGDVIRLPTSRYDVRRVWLRSGKVLPIQRT